MSGGQVASLPLTFTVGPEPTHCQAVEKLPTEVPEVTKVKEELTASCINNCTAELFAQVEQEAPLTQALQALAV